MTMTMLSVLHYIERLSFLFFSRLHKIPVLTAGCVYEKHTFLPEWSKMEWMGGYFFDH